MTFSLLFGFHSVLHVSDILLLHPSLPDSFCLGPHFHESPIDLIFYEANRIPFVSQDIDLDSWANNLRAWSNPPEGWVAWYNRVARVHQSTWETIGIVDALSLSLSPLDKNENLLKTISYFWSNALNCFLFGHSPMTPTLMDVVMITGLDIASPSPSTYSLPEVPFRLSSKSECTNCGAYLNQHVKTKGLVTERTHDLLEFLVGTLHILWSFPCPNQKLPFFSILVGQRCYCWPRQIVPQRSLQVPSLNIFELALPKETQNRRPLVVHSVVGFLYFQNHIPNFPVLTDNSFSDQTGKRIRCTNYGQALYSLPDSKLNLKDVSG
jgi:hypothetical protein